VRLMTIHAAKGLEFRAVAVADLGHRPQTAQPALLFDERRVGLRWTSPDGARKPRLEHKDLDAEAKQRAQAEEDRLLYVAMTRAEEHLILSGASGNWGNDSGSDGAMDWVGARLLKELDGSAQSVVRIAGSPVAVRTVNAENADRELSAPAPPPGDEDGHQGPVELHGPPADRPFLPEPTRLSYSSLSEIEQCGYRYYLTHLVGLPERSRPAGRGLSGRDRGTLVHSILERSGLAGELPRAEQVSAHAAELGIALGADDAVEVEKMLGAAAASPFAARIDFARARREVPFVFSVGDELPILEGFIDVLVAGPEGSALVVDYKTNRLDEETDLELYTQRTYGLQRLVYALAALRDGASEVEVAFWYLQRPDEPVLGRYTAAGAGELEAELAARAAAVLGGEYRVSERPHRFICAECPGLGTLCPVPREVALAD